MTVLLIGTSPEECGECVWVGVIFLQLSGAAGVHVRVCHSCKVERYSQGMCVCVECECAAGVVMLNGGASKCVCGVCHREVEVPQSVCVWSVSL